MYHSCGVKDGQYEGFEIPVGSYDFELQNAVTGCNYVLVSNSTSRSQYIPPCIGYKADQWMTFQVHIKIGTWYKNDHVYHHDSRIQLWVADENKPSTLVIDLNPADGTGYDLVNVENLDPSGAPKDKYGKVWLLPYNTNKDATEIHPTGYTWYDELIVSRQRVPDPGADSPVHVAVHRATPVVPSFVAAYDLSGRAITGLAPTRSIQNHDEKGMENRVRIAVYKTGNNLIAKPLLDR
jgi:hypothetical protein